MKKYKTVFDHPRKQNQIKVFGKDPETMSEFAQMCIDTINDKLAKSKENSKIHVVGLAMDIHHSDAVSNSHDAPLLGTGNFCRDDDAPTRYPGWRGRVWIRYSDDCRGWGSEQFEPTITHTGTGGSGSYNGTWEGIAHRYYKASIKQKKTFVSPELYSWDYRFFDQDFPGLDNEVLRLYNIEYKEYKKKYEHYLVEMTWYKATGKNRPLKPIKPTEPKFHMAWTEPEQAKKDLEFIQTIEKDALRRNLNKKYDPA